MRVTSLPVYRGGSARPGSPCPPPRSAIGQRQPVPLMSQSPRCVMKRFLVLAVLLLVLPAPAPSQPGKEKAIFRTAAVRRGALQPSVGATGTVHPEEVFEVAAPVAGVVVNLGTFDVGTAVEEGTILAQIDPSVYR